MIYSCRCGPAIEVLRTNEGFVYARQFRLFHSTSGIWRELADGKVGRHVSLQCHRCDVVVAYEEVRSIAETRPPWLTRFFLRFLDAG